MLKRNVTPILFALCLPACTAMDLTGSEGDHDDWDVAGDTIIDKDAVVVDGVLVENNCASGRCRLRAPAQEQQVRQVQVGQQVQEQVVQQHSAPTCQSGTCRRAGPVRQVVNGVVVPLAEDVVGTTRNLVENTVQTVRCGTQRVRNRTRCAGQRIRSNIRRARPGILFPK